MNSHKEPTLDQRRAGHAWEAVARVAERSGKLPKGYRREAKRLPVRILTAGLGHALAFARAKGGPSGEELLQDVADWVLSKRNRPDDAAPRPAADALIEKIIKGSATDLRLYTDETLAYLEWLTRFAEAKLEDDE